mmetsp:Transcript_22/g.27  ORF Transcript_22/g.27 Transcript_22/m.27 type:complete len:137 (-) Transcript_22:128-538(-)
MRSHYLALHIVSACVFFPKATLGRLGGFGSIYIYRPPPTSSPTSSPSYSHQPSPAPSMTPTYQPSGHPSSSHPSHGPSSQPTSSPSFLPSYQPSSLTISSSFMKSETGSYTSGFWWMISLVSILLCFLMLKFFLQI